MPKRTWTSGQYPAAVTERGIVVLEPGNEGKTPSKSLTLMITVHKVQLTETVAPPGRRMRKTQERQPVFG